jgi:hypothetical protein
VVEIQDWDKVAIHPDVSEAVDTMLRGRPIPTETRWLDETGEVRSYKEEPVTATRKTAKPRQPSRENIPRLYLFGVNRTRLEQTAKEMRLNLDVASSLNNASLLITSKNYYRRKPQKVRDAEAAGLPIYVLKSNTPPQIRQLLNTVYPTESTDRADSLRLALSQAEDAVGEVKTSQESVELSPQSAYIRRLQHLIARRHELSSRSLGKDPNRRVRIYRQEINV